MDLIKQVVSRELAEELKEAGYPQKEGLWWWRYTKGLKKAKLLYTPVATDDGMETWYGLYTWHDTKYAVAPTVAELINVLTRYRKSAIIIPVEQEKDVVNFLAQEVLDEKKREKKN